MNLKELKTAAVEKGINPGKMKKAELIQAIQRTEGNFDCFGTTISGFCDQSGCLWHKDCIEYSQKKCL